MVHFLLFSENISSREQELLLLKAGKGEKDRYENLKLVACLDRGGLWYISEEMEKIFLIVEKYFSIQVMKQGLKKIKIGNITDKLVGFAYVYPNVISSLPNSQLWSCR